MQWTMKTMLFRVYEEVVEALFWRLLVHSVEVGSACRNLGAKVVGGGR